MVQKNKELRVSEPGGLRKLCHTRPGKPFLAALSSSRSVVVGPLVGWLVGGLCEKVTFRVLNGNLNLPTYLPMQQ